MKNEDVTNLATGDDNGQPVGSMTMDHPLWEEFGDLLNDPNGIEFLADDADPWTCSGGEACPLSTTDQDYIQMAMANFLTRLKNAVGGWGILPMWVKDLDTPLNPSKIVTHEGHDFVLINGGANLGYGVSGVYRIVGAKVIHINPETKKNKDLIQKIRKLL